LIMLFILFHQLIHLHLHLRYQGRNNGT